MSNKPVRRARLVLATASGCLIAQADAQVAFTTGQVGVTLSWSGGDPLPGYEDPDTVYTGTDLQNYSGNYGHALASMAHMNPTVETYLVTDNTAFIQTPCGWGFYDMREHHFAIETTHTQNLTIDYAVDFTRDITSYGFFAGFDTATLQNMDTLAPPIDLLTTSSGHLAAGNYQWQTAFAFEWSTDQQFHVEPNANTMTLHFTVPAPGAVPVLAIGGLLAARRRRS